MSDSMRDTGPARHPAVVEFDSFRRANRLSFDGEASGVYLANRLHEAFMAGWNACERRVEEALKGQR